ncbi:unannotated protein [freshwater metagenome]|uniref:Unannotated protein n=1 Tax=freshwater metagenome TaxID=449393 RepID=A0A6J6XD64_9ZZZZ
MKRNARLESGLARKGEHANDVGRLCTELARERPIGTTAIVAQTHAYRSARSFDSNLVELGLDIDRVATHAARVRVCNVAALLDGVAVRDVVRVRPSLEAAIDLGRTGDIESGAERNKAANNRQCRVGLDRVIHAGRRNCLDELHVTLFDEIDVDDNERSRSITVAKKRVDLGGGRRDRFCHGGDDIKLDYSLLLLTPSVSAPVASVSNG